MSSVGTLIGLLVAAVILVVVVVLLTPTANLPVSTSTLTVTSTGIVATQTSTTATSTGTGTLVTIVIPNNAAVLGTAAFQPNPANVTVGTRVRWTNQDSMAHTVTSNSGLFDSGNIAMDAVYERVFLATGTFPYHCSLHPNMQGAVVVQ